MLSNVCWENESERKHKRENLSLTTKHQKGIPSEQLRNRFIPN
jgi:hypothetical protein